VAAGWFQHSAAAHIGLLFREKINIGPIDLSGS
jgi:hypothetical protein